MSRTACNHASRSGIVALARARARACASTCRRRASSSACKRRWPRPASRDTSSASDLAFCNRSTWCACFSAERRRSEASWARSSAAVFQRSAAFFASPRRPSAFAASRRDSAASARSRRTCWRSLATSPAGSGEGTTAGAGASVCGSAAGGAANPCTDFRVSVRSASSTRSVPHRCTRSGRTAGRSDVLAWWMAASRSAWPCCQASHTLPCKSVSPSSS